VRLFDKLKVKLDYLSDEEIEKIYQAYLVANTAHEGQKRSTGEAYITHPVAVAGILADMRMDHQSIMAALLHDVIEDTGVDKQALTEQFGEEVAELVDGVSKLTQIEFSSRAEAQAENFRKMLLAMARDIRVILVKLSDRLHNMRTLETLIPEKRRRVSRETLEIFAPIANRLGMHRLSLELEDLGFKALYPFRYRALKNALAMVRGIRKEIMAKVQQTLQDGLNRVGLKDFEISGREKHLYSIYKKMRDKHLSFAEITDVYAFRIVVDTVDHCYQALGIAHSLYKPVSERFKDYIAIPKANGYQSLHSTLFGPYGLPMEIQIRTQAMEQMASSGIAAHWLYKSGDKFNESSQVRAQQWVRNLLEMQQRTGSSLEFIENVKIDLFPDEVYIFTPKGAIMELPAGATAVDFAYTVHTDIGDTCVAAKIDRQLASLSTTLKSGQTVEIITAPGARPNPVWLDFVVTSKARSGIRHFLKTQQRSESVSLGKKLLNKALSSLGLSLKKISPESMQFLLKEVNLETTDDLLEDIGLGNRVAMLVANRLAAAMSEKEMKVDTIRHAKPLEIKGTEGMVVNYASCCYPIPGDPIVGVLNAGQGILVHMEQCKQLQLLRHHPERYMPVRWAEQVQGEFMVPIKVEVINERGMLAAIALAIAEAEANIDDVSVNERDGRHYQVQMKISVHSRIHLARVMRNVRKLKSVLKIFRGK
jgi:guanosine-3',5'-bis(diphosphate) 3'-pyrophosphohydrolase